MVTDGSSLVKPMRAEPRMKVLLAAELRTETGGTTCRIIDLSRSGACLELDGPVAIGSEVTLQRGAMRTRGQVVWLRGRRCGVRFEEQIRATDLLVQMSESRKSQVTPEPLPLSAAAIALSPSS